MVRFLEISYTGSADGKVFDTTDPTVLPEAKPVILPVEEGILVKGLARFLKEKGPGEYEVTLSPEDAFGKKDARLIQLIPRSQFAKAGLKPYVGLEIEADGLRGRVISMSGGRITVDFNHPLAGKEVTYTIKVIREVTDPTETVPALIRLLLTIGDDAYQVQVEGKTIRLTTSLPEAFHKTLRDVVSQYHPDYTVEVIARETATTTEGAKDDGIPKGTGKKDAERMSDSTATEPVQEDELRGQPRGQRGDGQAKQKAEGEKNA